MPQLRFEQWPVLAVYNQLGDEILADYSIYHRDRKVFRVIPAGRLDNMYRVYYSRAESVVVSKDTMLKVGI